MSSLVPPMPTPVPAPSKTSSASGWALALIVLIIFGYQTAHFVLTYYHTLPVPAPAVKAVITDVSGNTPNVAPSPGSLLVLSSQKSTANATRWSVSPPTIDAYQSGTDFVVVVPPTPFHVSLLVTRNDKLDVANLAFNSDSGPSPGPAPGPPPGPAPAPKPDPTPAPPPTPLTPIQQTTKAYIQAERGAFLAVKALVDAGKVNVAGTDGKQSLATALLEARRPITQPLADALKAAPDLSAALQQVADVMEVGP